MRKSGKKVEGARKLVEARLYKLSEATELIKKTHHTYKAAPAAITGTAAHAATVAECPLRVTSHQGTQTPPSPGTTMVNSTLRTIRLSVRHIAALLQESGESAAGFRPGRLLRLSRA